MAIGDILGGVKDFAYGLGEYARRTDPQYAIADAQRQEMEILKNAERRQALLRDFYTGAQMINAGRVDQATQLFGNRLEMLKKLNAPNIADTQAIYDRLVSGDPAKIQEVSDNLGAFIQTGMAMGEFGGATGQKGFQFGAQETFADSTGNLFMGTMVNDPNSGRSVPSVVAVDGSGAQPQGQLQLVNSIGLTANQIPGQRGAEQSAIERARTDAAYFQELERIRGGNAAKSGVGGGVSDAELEADKKARTAAITQSTAYLDRVDKIRSGLYNIDDAISAIDAGADTGKVASYLPSFRDSTLQLESTARRMGLDVVGSVTFGALSEAELKMAMQTGLPTDMDQPKLRQWLVDRKIAQTKLADYLENAAIYLGEPGNTPASWAKLQKERREQSRGSQGSTQTGGKVVDWNDL